MIAPQKESLHRKDSLVQPTLKFFPKKARQIDTDSELEAKIDMPSTHALFYLMICIDMSSDGMRSTLSSMESLSRSHFQ